MYAAVQPLRNSCRKLSEIRVTRWLIWHSCFKKLNFGRAPPQAPLGSLQRFPRPSIQLGMGYPTSNPIDAEGVESQAPRNGHWRWPLTPISGSAPGGTGFLQAGWRSYHPTNQQPLPSNRQHQSCDDCLEVRRENNQICSVLCCVRQLCTMIRTHTYELFLNLHVGLGLDFVFVCLFRIRIFLFLC